uniref:Brix domain-containing protein n=1 Tax=Parastrongyloides trichosuri TaxID=131310 RepID=A0A0N4ZSL0_PARTI
MPRGSLIKKFQNKNEVKEKNKSKKVKKEEHEEDGKPAVVTRTIENTRELCETMIDLTDPEILHDQDNDEFASYFKRETTPKILMTTSMHAKTATFDLMRELEVVIPNVEVHSRKMVPIKRIVEQAIENDFTDIIIIQEDRKKPAGMIFCHLPEGPTAYFKINSLTPSKKIKNVGQKTDHYPELILNNFDTRLGFTIGRMFASIFPQDPEHKGRRVVTFHNQRDYIFFRHHRYEFKKDGTRAALHELGPRITFRLKWLQKGTFDTIEGEYEWVYKRRIQQPNRRTFVL